MPLVRHACLHILNTSYNSGGLSSLAPLFWGSRPEKSENPCSSPLDLLFYYFKRPIILWNHLIGLHWILGPLPQSEYLDNMMDFNFQTDLTYVSFFQFVLCGPINQNKLLLSTRSMLQCQLVHAWKSLMPCYKIVFFFKKIGTTSGGQLNTPSDYEFQHLHNQLFVNAGTTSSGVANIWDNHQKRIWTRH